MLDNKNIFDIIEQPCKFCQGSPVVLYDEHYTFCPGCGGIATNFWLHRAGCKHVTQDTITAVRLPSLIGVVVAGVIQTGEPRGYLDLNRNCSICGAKSNADGW